MSPDRVGATRRIAAPASKLFQIVSRPSGQVAIDGSGMLDGAPDDRSLTTVGETFDMDMDREPLGDIPNLKKYQVRNAVTQIVPDHLVEWTMGFGDSPPFWPRLRLAARPSDRSRDRRDQLLRLVKCLGRDAFGCDVAGRTGDDAGEVGRESQPDGNQYVTWTGLPSTPPEPPNVPDREGARPHSHCTEPRRSPTRTVCNDLPAGTWLLRWRWHASRGRRSGWLGR